jgi:DNA end-binding protein Ku
MGAGDYIAFEPEEIAKAVPKADKTLNVVAFVPCGQVDDVYFDRPYYLAPSTPAGAKAFLLIRDGMAQAEVTAIARTVLFRRVRSVLIRAHGGGLIAHTLNFDYEAPLPPDLRDGATLAISVEPLGGSPIQQPTGPVVFVGTVKAV